MESEAKLFSKNEIHLGYNVITAMLQDHYFITTEIGLVHLYEFDENFKSITEKLTYPLPHPALNIFTSHMGFTLCLYGGSCI